MSVGFYKKCVNDFAKFTGKHLCHCLFFNEVGGLGSATLLKKTLWHSGTGAFLWILQTFQEQLFYRPPPGDCFWLFLSYNRSKKILLFPEMRVTRKIFPRAAAFFFNLFSREILFSSLASFAFLYFCLFFYFLIVYFEIKNIYSNIHLTMRASEW